MRRTFVALLFCGALFAQETPRDGAAAEKGRSRRAAALQREQARLLSALERLMWRRAETFRESLLERGPNDAPFDAELAERFEARRERDALMEASRHIRQTALAHEMKEVARLLVSGRTLEALVCRVEIDRCLREVSQILEESLCETLARRLRRLAETQRALAKYTTLADGRRPATGKERWRTLASRLGGLRVGRLRRATPAPTPPPRSRARPGRLRESRVSSSGPSISIRGGRRARMGRLRRRRRPRFRRLRAERRRGGPRTGTLPRLIFPDRFRRRRSASPTRGEPAPTGADLPGGAGVPQTRTRRKNCIHAGGRSWKTISKRWTRGAGRSGDDERNGFSERGRLLPTAGDEIEYKIVH